MPRNIKVNILIEVIAGMVRNSATLRKNIGKRYEKKKRMTNADIKKCGKELEPYWKDTLKRFQEGNLMPGD